VRGDVNGCDLRKNPRAILNRASTQRRLFSSPKSRRDDLFVALRMPTCEKALLRQVCFGRKGD